MTVIDFETARRKRTAKAVRDEARAIRTSRPSLIERILEGDAMRRVSQAMADAWAVSTRVETTQTGAAPSQPNQNMPFSRREDGTQ